jgi:hypothetical protein
MCWHPLPHWIEPQICNGVGFPHAASASGLFACYRRCAATECCPDPDGFEQRASHRLEMVRAFGEQDRASACTQHVAATESPPCAVSPSRFRPRLPSALGLGVPLPRLHRDGNRSIRFGTRHSKADLPALGGLATGRMLRMLQRASRSHARTHTHSFVCARSDAAGAPFRLPGDHRVLGRSIARIRAALIAVFPLRWERAARCALCSWTIGRAHRGRCISRHSSANVVGALVKAESARCGRALRRICACK